MTELRPPTTEFLPQVVRDGACICWSASTLTVPIPLIDLRVQTDRLFTWATIQTPFGGERPLFGLVEYAEERRQPGGVTFWDATGHALCAIVPNHFFGFPAHTEAKLRSKVQTHHLRLSQDSTYAAMWEDHFTQGTSECVANGQTFSRTTKRLSDSDFRTVVLADERNGADSRFLSASLKSSGDLMLEGHDLGPKVKEFWPDDEYEYWRRVNAAKVPKVLLFLLKEKFKREGDFAKWLKANEIPSEFHNWV